MCSLEQFFYSEGLHNYTKPYVCLFFSLINIPETGQVLIAPLRRMTSIIQNILITAYFISSMMKKKKKSYKSESLTNVLAELKIVF